MGDLVKMHKIVHSHVPSILTIVLIGLGFIGIFVTLWVLAVGQWTILSELQQIRLTLQ